MCLLALSNPNTPTTRWRTIGLRTIAARLGDVRHHRERLRARAGNPATDVGSSVRRSSVARLRRFCSDKEHVFWPESVSLTDRIFNPSLIRGYRQVSDIYLLGLAKKMGGYLATFDGGIPLGAVVGATRNTIAVISAGDSDE